MKRFALALLATVCTTAGLASAQPVCMQAVEMEAALIDWYGEAPVEGAWANDQQLWASENTGTWTLMQLRTDGTACVLSQGNNWQPNDDPVVALRRSLEIEGDRAPVSALALLEVLQADAS